MKKVFFILMITCFALAPRLFSMELELIGGLGNLAFDHGRTKSIGGEDGAFSPEFFPVALARVSGERGGLSWNAGFERDPLTRSTLFGNVKAELGYFSVEAGPFIGLFNAGKRPLNPGVSAGVELSVPGIIFVRAGGSSTLTAVMNIETPYFQTIETGNVSLGFWVPYVICSLNVNFKSFSGSEGANLIIEDKEARWFFSADVFTKNVPYTVRVDLGYEKLSRSYVTRKINGADIENDTETDEVKAVFVGIEGTYTLNPSLKIILGGEMPVYSWAARPMKNPPDDTMLFKARAGIVWTFGGGGARE